VIHVRLHQNDAVVGEITWNGRELVTSGWCDKLRYMALRGNTEAYLRGLPDTFSGPIRAELHDDSQAAYSGTS
jgi:hypothetical protein